MPHRNSRRKRMFLSVLYSPIFSGIQLRRCGFYTGAALSLRMQPHSCRSPMWTARWAAAQASIPILSRVLLELIGKFSGGGLNWEDEKSNIPDGKLNLECAKLGFEDAKLNSEDWGSNPQDWGGDIPDGKLNIPHGKLNIPHGK